MPRIEEIIAEMHRNPKGIRFDDLCRVCDFYFDEPRQRGGSHCVYKMPWQGDPRVNVQDDRGVAKPYPVRQVLSAIEKLEASRGSKG